MQRATRRMADSAGMMLIGDGVLAMWHPERHCRAWRGKSGAWSRMIDWFIDHPGFVRALAVAEIAAGLALAARQETQAG